MYALLTTGAHASFADLARERLLERLAGFEVPAGRLRSSPFQVTSTIR
jgi:hypothetical protein